MTTPEFMQKIVQDEALRSTMSAYKTPEEAYEAAKSHGLTDDKETFMATMTAAQKAISGELTDEELEEIAGGMSTGGIVAVTLGPTAALASVTLAF